MAWTPGLEPMPYEVSKVRATLKLPLEATIQSQFQPTARLHEITQSALLTIQGWSECISIAGRINTQVPAGTDRLPIRTCEPHGGGGGAIPRHSAIGGALPVWLDWSDPPRIPSISSRLPAAFVGVRWCWITSAQRLQIAIGGTDENPAHRCFLTAYGSTAVYHFIKTCRQTATCGSISSKSRARSIVRDRVMTLI